MLYVFMYLAAIVLANLLTTHFGPSMSIINAFLFIGLDLTARDKLHETWHNNGLIWKMGLLISAGALLSWVINQNAAQIALASMLAFGLSAIADTFVYHFLRGKTYLVKVNGSNVVSAAVDSLVFPTVAFGGFLPWITLGQFLAKVFGGALWAWVLNLKLVDDSEEHSGMW